MLGAKGRGEECLECLGGVLDESWWVMNESVMVGSEERGIYTSSEKHPLRSTSGVPTQILGLPTLTRNTVQRRVEDTVGTTLSKLPTYVGTSDEGLTQMDSRQRVRTPDTMSGLPTLPNKKKYSKCSCNARMTLFRLDFYAGAPYLPQTDYFCIPLCSTAFLNSKAKIINLKLRFELESCFNFMN